MIFGSCVTSHTFKDLNFLLILFTIKLLDQQQQYTKKMDIEAIQLRLFEGITKSWQYISNKHGQWPLTNKIIPILTI